MGSHSKVDTYAVKIYVHFIFYFIKMYHNTIVTIVYSVKTDVCCSKGTQSNELASFHLQ